MFFVAYVRGKYQLCSKVAPRQFGIKGYNIYVIDPSGLRVIWRGKSIAEGNEIAKYANNNPDKIRELKNKKDFESDGIPGNLFNEDQWNAIKVDHYG